MTMTPHRALRLLSLIADCQDILETERIAQEDGEPPEEAQPPRRHKAPATPASALTPPDNT